MNTLGQLTRSKKPYPFLWRQAIRSALAGITLVACAAQGLSQEGRRADPRRDSGILVKFRGGPRGPAAEQARSRLRHEVLRSFDHFGWQQIAPAPGLDVVEALQQYGKHPDVLAVETNSAASATSDLLTTGTAAADPANDRPNDPRFSAQWALQRIHAPVAWLDQRGNAEVVVAVIDTGVNYLHEDLRENLWRNPGEIPGNGVDDDGNGRIDDVHGIDTANDAQGNDSDPFDRGADGYYHGTMVAGIIGASGNNALGVAGVNWSVRLMALRSIRAGNLITIADELEALDYVLEMKQRGVNLRAINMSYGGLAYSQAERDALGALADAGILLCAAAGNSSTNNDVTPLYPASHPIAGIIAVAATDEADELATFPTGRTSQYGLTNVDLAAPGLHVTSTYGSTTNAYRSDFFGTSAATPHVAGAVALLAAANPEATPADLKAALLESVDQVPALTNRMVSHGRLNLGRAIDHPRIARGPPRVGGQPQDTAVVLSNRVTLSAVVFGARPRVSQWGFNGEDIPGATNEALTIARAEFGNSGNYLLMVSNVAGVAVSRDVTLTVMPLSVTNQPQSQAVRAGNNAKFTVGIASPVAVAHQWLHNGQVLPGATNSSLSLTGVQADDDGWYSVAVSNRFGNAESEPARLTVLINPVITAPPVSQSLVQGGSVTFSVGFTGNPAPFGVQWQQGSTRIASNTVEFAQDFFTLTNVQPAHAGTWRVVVRNQADPVTGAQRSFNVVVLPDTDSDGMPDAWELAHGFRANDPTDAVRDADGDGSVNRDEYVAGSNPTNWQSHLRLDRLTRANDVTAITFQAVSNRTYTVEARALVENPLTWSKVSDVLAGRTNRAVTVLDADSGVGAGARFYRLVTPRRQ